MKLFKKIKASRMRKKKYILNYMMRGSSILSIQFSQDVKFEKGDLIEMDSKGNFKMLSKKQKAGLIVKNNSHLLLKSVKSK